jgi:hypothetical protein
MMDPNNLTGRTASLELYVRETGLTIAEGMETFGFKEEEIDWWALALALYPTCPVQI